MRSFAALIGNTILVLVLGASVIFFSYFFDALGILSLPPVIWEAPLSLLTPRPAAVTLTIPDPGAPTWTSPLGTPRPAQQSTAVPEVFITLPAGTPAPAAVAPPAPAPPTPVPPMGAPQYRDAVMVNLKAFAQAAQNWLDANDELKQDPALTGDPAWQDKTALLLEQVSAAAASLNQVGPAPAEYAGVDAQLKRILPEADALRQNYTAALQTGSADQFEAAGQNFANIKDILTQAVGEMQLAGWPVEE